ncbi:hypothetical protein OAF52_01250 [bacterium]|nr:hypothetical protein [bacterium]
MDEIIKRERCMNLKIYLWWNNQIIVTTLSEFRVSSYLMCFPYNSNFLLLLINFVNKVFRVVVKKILITIGVVLLIGCSKGWVLDYHEPAAQFLAKDVSTKAMPYVGRHEKITIKGIVTKVNLNDPDSSLIYLKEGIECKLSIRAMASTCKV